MKVYSKFGMLNVMSVSKLHLWKTPSLYTTSVYLYFTLYFTLFIFIYTYLQKDKSFLQLKKKNCKMGGSARWGVALVKAMSK